MYIYVYICTYMYIYVFVITRKTEKQSNIYIGQQLNGQQMDKKRKTVIKIFKDIGFIIDI